MFTKSTRKLKTSYKSTQTLITINHIMPLIGLLYHQFVMPLIDRPII